MHAFFQYVISDDLIRFAIDLIGEKKDIRFYMHLLLRAGKLAEENDHTFITREEIRSAYYDLHQFFTALELSLKKLPNHPLLVLLAFIRVKHIENKVISRHTVYTAYRDFCTKGKIDAKSSAQIDHYLDTLKQDSLSTLIPTDTSDEQILENNITIILNSRGILL